MPPTAGDRKGLEGMEGTLTAPGAIGTGRDDWPGLGPLSRIATLSGPVPLHLLRPGELVLTRDRGYQPLIWVATAGTPGDPLPAVTIPGDATLVVSPAHGILVHDRHAVAHHGTAETLAPAGDLAAPTIMRFVDSLWQIVLASHELVLANGTWVETLSPHMCPLLFPGLALHSGRHDAVAALRPRYAAAPAGGRAGQAA